MLASKASSVLPKLAFWWQAKPQRVNQQCQVIISLINKFHLHLINWNSSETLFKIFSTGSLVSGIQYTRSPGTTGFGVFACLDLKCNSLASLGLLSKTRPYRLDSLNLF